MTLKSEPNQNPVEALKGATIGMRLRWHWMARKKAVSETLKESMVSILTTTQGRADEDSYAVTSKLFNPKMECFKELAKFKGETQRWWEDATLPYMEPGIRLLPRESVESVNAALFTKKGTFYVLAGMVQDVRAAIIEEARQRLKAGFDINNYPDDLSTLFGMEWAFVSVEPPSYLAKLCPSVFQQEVDKAQAALKQSMEMAQQAFVLQFKNVVDALHERLTPSGDGSKKIFRDSAVENITDFVNRFQKLNITGQADLEALVVQAKELIANVEPGDLRNLETLRQEVAQGLGEIKGKLEPLVTTKPRRKVMKATPATTPTPEETHAPASVA